MKEKLPILMVAPRNEDIRPNSGGGKITFLEKFTENLRNSIVFQCNNIKSELNQIEEKSIPCVGKVIMKEKAIAKTHKPNNLFNAETCPMIGTGNLNEIYIKMTSNGIENLVREVNSTNAKTKQAEMTKIERIERYTAKDILKVDLKNINEPLKIKLFDFKNEEQNQKNEVKFLEKLEQLGLRENVSKLEIYKTMKVYLLNCNNADKVKLLAEYQGIKSIDMFQKYSISTPKIKKLEEMEYSFPKPIEGKDYPIIGLIDSGISYNNENIKPWIYKKEELVPKDYQNNSHATFIAGVMLFGNKLNYDNHSDYVPNFKILDVVAIPNADPDYGLTDDLTEDVFLERLEDIMKKYSKDVKIWNLSLGTDKEVDDVISDFAVELDRIQDEYGVQMFIAAGNFESDIREWPVKNDYFDRVTTPADSIRGITVGSIALDNGAVKKDEPSPFSRRGPGANFINKPDIVDYGGNINNDGTINGCGIVSFDNDGNFIEGVGTSYSTPFAVTKFQNILDNINNSNSLELSKALLIHSCINPITKDIKIEEDEMKYYGFGIAQDDLDEILKCDNSKVTIIFQGSIKDGEHVEIEDIPYPESLHKRGKWYGKITATLVYNPKLDSSEGQEYCRSNIDFSMGLHNLNRQTGELEYKGQVPLEKRWDEKYEAERVKNGAKWSPIKRHYRHIKNGIQGQDWKIRLDCTNRNNTNDIEQSYTLIVTIDSESEQSDIYTEMVNGLKSRGFVINNLQLRNELQLRN